MPISSRVSGTAVVATVAVLFSALYFVLTTSDGRLALYQLSICAEVQFLVAISWLLAKLLTPEDRRESSAAHS